MRHYREQHYTAMPLGIFGVRETFECRPCHFVGHRAEHLRKHLASIAHRTRLIEQGQASPADIEAHRIYQRDLVAWSSKSKGADQDELADWYSRTAATAATTEQMSVTHTTQEATLSVVTYTADTDSAVVTKDVSEKRPKPLTYQLKLIYDL